MIRGIIFDFDGVLVESFDIKTKAFARLFESEAPEAVKEVLAYHVTHGGVSRFEKFRHIYREILRRELTDEAFRDLCDKFQGLVMEEVIAAPMVKGAAEFLDRSRGRYAIFVCSGTPQKEIQLIIGRRKMSRYFKRIYGAPAEKREIVRSILLENRYDPGEAVYVGDAPSDFEAAISNGVAFVGRIVPGNDILSGPFSKISDITELESAIGIIEKNGSDTGIDDKRK